MSVQFFLIIFLASNTVFAGLNFNIKGEAVHIKDGQAVVESKHGIQKLPLKRLSKANVEKIKKGISSKKNIHVRIPVETFIVRRDN